MARFQDSVSSDSVDEIKNESAGCILPLIQVNRVTLELITAAKMSIDNTI